MAIEGMYDVIKVLGRIATALEAIADHLAPVVTMMEAPQQQAKEAPQVHDEDVFHCSEEQYNLMRTYLSAETLHDIGVRVWKVDSTIVPPPDAA